MDLDNNTVEQQSGAYITPRGSSTSQHEPPACIDQRGDALADQIFERQYTQPRAPIPIMHPQHLRPAAVVSRDGFALRMQAKIGPQPRRILHGSLGRTLMGKPFPKDYQFPGQLQKKNSVTAHLPKGNAARLAKKPLDIPFRACSAT